MARGILGRPDLLVLDEATAQIDAITEAAIAETVHGIAQQGAVLTIAHRLSTILDADRIVVLDQGRIRAIGTHAELQATDELYRELLSALRISERDGRSASPEVAAT